MTRKASERKRHKLPANVDEVTLYCFVGEALWKIQVVEQALSHSITIKMNPDATKEEADEFLKQQQSYTLGKAVKIAVRKKLFCLPLLEEINNFLDQRNWLVHKSMPESAHGLNWEDNKEDLFNRIKDISDKAESIHREIEDDLLDFCASKGRDMPKLRELLNLQDQGVRIQRDHSS